MLRVFWLEALRFLLFDFLVKELPFFLGAILSEEWGFMLCMSRRLLGERWC